jgi:PhzF family phenazine biosynthesis protein
MELKLFTVDAFTDKPFAGNPAAVCIVENELTETQMKNIAFEMNLAETAFVRKKGDIYGLRWFTPESEVDLCGHATLATSHILWQTGLHDKSETISYDTRSGILKANRVNDKIVLDFPADPEHAVDIPDALVKTLGARPVYLGMAKWSYVAEMDSEDTVRKVVPDFILMKTLEAWGVIITARSKSPEFDFISRFFAPGKGVQEDPVTGSAHCALGPYWMKKLGKNEMRAFQASERGGVLDVKVDGDRIKLSGNAVTVIEGKFHIS